MKKIYIFRFAAMLAFVAAIIGVRSCSEPPTDWDVALSVQLDSGDVGREASSQNLRIESDGSWNITVDYLSPEGVVSWVTLSKNNGSGNETVSVSYGENAEYTRSAMIIVRAGSVQREVLLTQEGALGIGTGTPPRWTELPSVTVDENTLFYTHFSTMHGERARNYSVYYDKQTKTALWVAYPLCATHAAGSGSLSSWYQDPEISGDYQMQVSSGYGVSYPDKRPNINTNDVPNFYARGHQIPNGDRNGVSAMQRQTYYWTNSTPQIQYGFNSGIWSTIEGLINSVVYPASTAKADTVWVVTGASFRDLSSDEPEHIEYITNAINNGSEQVRVPKYYYKVALRRKDSGYTAVGFWIEHKTYSGSAPKNFAMPVRDIERKTGFDFFANLPQAQQNEFETTLTESDWF